MRTADDEQIQIDDHVLFTYIDHWEKYSITKIQVTAQQARTDLRDLFYARTLHLVTSLDQLKADIELTSIAQEVKRNQLQTLREDIENFFSYIHLEHNQNETPIHLIKLNFENGILKNETNLDVPGARPLSLAMLRNVSPIERKQLLGERLFVRIQQIEPRLAAKITGMFLEYENEHVIILLTSPAVLREKIRESVQILQLYNRMIKRSV